MEVYEETKKKVREPSVEKTEVTKEVDEYAEKMAKFIFNILKAGMLIITIIGICLVTWWLFTTIYPSLVQAGVISELGKGGLFADPIWTAIFSMVAVFFILKFTRLKYSLFRWLR